MAELKEIMGYAAMVSSGNLFTSVLNFMTFMVMVNALGAQGFGLLSLALSVLSFAVIFLDMGLGKVLVADVSKEISEGSRENAAALFQGYAFFEGAVMVLLSAGTFVFANQIAAYFAKDLSTIIRLVSILIFTGGIKNVYSVSFEIVADFRKYASLLFIEALSKFVLVFFAINYFGATVENTLLALIAADFLLIALRFSAIPKVSKELLLRKVSGRKKILTTFRRHGKWAIIYSQLRNLESNLPIWIVQYFLGIGAVGIYAALVKIQVLAIRLFEPLETIFYPLVSRFGKFEDSKKIIMRATKYLFYISLSVVFVSIVFTETVMGIILKGNYLEYGNVLRVLLLTVPIFVLNIPMKPFFFNLKAQKNLTIVSLAVFLSTLTLGSILTIKLGLLGIALNHVITPTIDLLLKNRMIKKITGVKYSIKDAISLDKADFDLFRRIPRMVAGIFSRKKGRH